MNIVSLNLDICAKYSIFHQNNIDEPKMHLDFSLLLLVKLSTYHSPNFATQKAITLSFFAYLFVLVLYIGS